MPAEAASTQPVMTTPSQALGLQEVIGRLREVNRSILSKQAEAAITATGIERARAAFQPQLTAAAVRGDSRQKNTFEEELIRQNLGVYDRQGSDFSAGVSAVIPATGAKVELKSSLSRFITNNNKVDPNRPPGAYDNRSATALSVTQPLARDAGPEVTQAKLNMARLDTVAAEHASRDTETSVVAEAVLAYHELVFAQQRVMSAEEKINTSTSLLAQAQALRRQGRLAQTEVWEVENALARYRAALSEAVQYQRERSNRLRSMLMLEPSAVLFRPVDTLPEVTGFQPDGSEVLRTALSKRDDYLMRKAQVEREGIQLSYAKNQKLPRVDLVASYGVNGLEYSGRQAIEWSRARDYPSWTMGLQVSVPLGANKQAIADLQAAVLRREDALLSVQAMETQIAADIDTSMGLIASMSERWKLWLEVAERETAQLQAEQAKFAAGRSDTRELLLRQERVINARLSVLEQQVGFARAQTLLQAAQGVLMERFP
jgi:outer membrane protein TolC